MTYGVPYLFVPGTKAKASEVNANFISILDKIETVNSRIDTANENIAAGNLQTEETIAEIETRKLNNDLSNLSAAGQNILNAKANASDIDGVWVAKSAAVVMGKTISANVTQHFDIRGYLPDNVHRFEVIIAVLGQCASTTNACGFINVQSDIIRDNIPVCRMITKGNYANYSSGQIVIPVSGPSARISIYNTSGASGNSTYSAYLFGYRKVR